MLRRNLFPNPDFQPGGAQPSPNGVTMAMSGGSLSLKATDNDLNRYAQFVVGALDPGSRLVLAIRVTDGVNTQYPNVTVSSSSWSQLATLAPPDGQTHATQAFTVPADGVLRILLHPYRHDSASSMTTPRVFTQPQLESASTYNGNEQGGGRFSAAPPCRCSDHRAAGRPC